MKYTDFSLPVEISGVKFRNPFFVASGPTTMSIDQIKRINETGWGGASLKLTIFPTPYINRKPRYGYYNKEGYLAFTAEKRLTMDQLLSLIEQARKEAPDLVLFSNITYTGEDYEGWGKMAKQCEDAGVHINEINVGCPNMSFNVEMSGNDKGGPKTGASQGKDVNAVKNIVKAVKEATSIPVFVKFSPEGGMMRYSAKAALDAGADAVGSNANRLAIATLDLDNPELSTNNLQKDLGLSCMSGTWALPLGKRDAYEIRRMVGPDVVITGTGGVTTWRDAVEMAMCGADLIGICTATLTHGFGFMPEFIHGVKEYMKEKGYKNFRDMRDLAVKAIKPAPELTLYDGHIKIKDPYLSAPCVFHCPAHVPAQGYIRAVADEDFEKAFDLITSKNPFQSICGVICDHPCEDACTRRWKDQPLRIRDIKDFVLTYAKGKGWKPKVEKTDKRDEKIAVIGAGPGGLSAAYDLARAGYNVTVFEKSNESGGALREFIPKFRMEKSMLAEEIDSVKSLGVEIKNNIEFGKDITIDSLKKDGYKAIYISIGAWMGLKPGIPGEDSEGCVTAIDFLKNPIDIKGKTVSIIGGGFSAIDSARTCVRLGAEKVYLLYRRTKDEMPATAEEVTEAEEEGVKVMYLVAPKEVLVKNNKVEGLKVVNHVLGKHDKSGRRSPESVENTEFILQTDVVIFAVSQGVGTDNVPAERSKNGFFTIDKTTCKTNINSVYAGGDCTGGRMDVISAIADGKRAGSEY